MLPQYLLLLFLGGSILISIILARGATLLKSPLIVGYIVAGALLGPDVLGFITEKQIASLDTINLIVLSLIGFGIGGELRFKELKKLGKSIILIVLLEAFGAFLLVGITSALILKSIPMGLIFGSLASATAPAGTVEVIRQYKAKGEFTTTLYAVMGLDDIIALLLFTISLPLAVILMVGTKSGGSTSILHALQHSGIEVLLSISIGLIIGFVIIPIAKLIHDRVNLLLFALGIVLINCGISEYLKLSPILLNMTLGIVLVNRNSLVSRKIFTALGDWSPPMYVWFFVLIGTRLNISLIMQYSLLIGIYIIARSFGKWSGTFLGGTISKAPKKIKNFLGLALMSQAGVAVGLALAASKILEQNGLHIQSVQLISSITATTFIVMLIGPIMAKIALFKSGETNISK
ncbi:MAG TPA: cation:proton antiporter [Candidatus Cloacimonetes bacterium]|nr:cation:proton antiporter [Candidatus Cloacimonadota bacterium]